MTKKRKGFIILCATLLILTVTIGATLAYFHDEDQKINTFTGAGNPGADPDSGLKIDLEEPAWVPADGLNILPGDVIPKDPTVKNLKDDSYVRMIVTLKDKAGNVISDPAKANKIFSMLYYAATPITVKQTAAQLATYPRVNSAFVLDTTRSSAGVYYYNYNAIMHHDEVKTLFTGVIVPTDWDQTDILAIGNYDIVVTAQAIQAKNLTNAAEAFAALDVEVARK